MSKWLILWCKEDSSYSLVGESDVICDMEHLSINDEVKFYFGKYEFTGVVKRVGDDEDYVKMQMELIELNKSNKKKQDSFHAENPRKAAMRSKDQIKVLTSSNKSKSQQSKAKNEAKKKNSGGKKVTASSTSTGDGLSSKNKDMRQKGHSSMSSQMIYGSSEEEDNPSKTDWGDNRAGDMFERQSASSSEENQSLESLRLNSKSKRELTERHTARDVNALKKLKSSMQKDDCHQTSSSIPTNDTKDSDDDNPAMVRGQKVGALSNNNKHMEKNKKECKKTGSDKRKHDLPSSRSQSFLQETEKMQEDEVKGENDVSEMAATKNKVNNNLYVDSDDKADDSNKNTSPALATGRNRNGAKSTKDNKQCSISPSSEGEFLSFDDEMYSYKATDEEVIELKGSLPSLGSIYVHADLLREAKDAASNASMYARQLLMKVFTPQALHACTISGGTFKAGGKEKMIRKPALDRSGVEIILEVALARQKARDWNPKYDKRSLKNSLRQKLVDERNKMKRKAAQN